MEEKAVFVLKMITALIALSGLIMLGFGWYLHSREPSPVLVFVILGILTSVLGIKFKTTQTEDPDKIVVAPKASKTDDTPKP